jgi:3-hydroxypropanoate dehydrogenase
MASAVNDSALDQIFREARTQNGWLDKPVSDVALRQLYDLAKMGPTSANCQPMRLVFLRSKQAKERLKPFLAPTNVEKTMSAPVTVIVAHDLEFYERLPELFPHTDARSWFLGNDELIRSTAFRNGTLQGGYLILAARALGLDCGPLSGFDSAKVDDAFFPDGKVKSNFLVNLGYGDASKVFPRSPRPTFESVCRVE